MTQILDKKTFYGWTCCPSQTWQTKSSGHWQICNSQKWFKRHLCPQLYWSELLYRSPYIIFFALADLGLECKKIEYMVVVKEMQLRRTSPVTAIFTGLLKATTVYFGILAFISASSFKSRNVYAWDWQQRPWPGSLKHSHGRWVQQRRVIWNDAPVICCATQTGLLVKRKVQYDE